MCTCICEWKSLPVCLPDCLPVCLPDCLSTWLSVYLSVCLSTCLSTCLSVCLFVCLSVYLSVCLSVCLCLHLSFCLFSHRQQIEDCETEIQRLKELLKKREENERKYHGQLGACLHPRPYHSAFQKPSLLLVNLSALESPANDSSLACVLV